MNNPNQPPRQSPSSLAPFSCTYSPNVPELLYKLKISLALSTYQAGKLIFLSPKDENYLVQLPRTFDKPMGIAIREGDSSQMALACKDEVIILADSPDLAYHYPKKPQTYDALYIPRVSYNVGSVDVHDLEWGGNEGKDLFAVNTLFSCIMKVDDRYNFQAHWRPNFITELKPEDRCHLNGMVMQDGKPKYVSCFNQGNSPQSWREEVTSGGLLIDVESNEIVVSGLAMPHSPRMFDGKLYVLLSATSELICVDVEKGTYESICQLDGFVRGMSYYEEFAFIGLSKLRKNSSTFAKLAIAEKANYAGIKIVHLPTGSLVGEIRYQSSVDEIYDIQVLPNKLRPNILNKDMPVHKMGIHLPDSTYWARQDNT